MNWLDVPDKRFLDVKEGAQEYSEHAIHKSPDYRQVTNWDFCRNSNELTPDVLSVVRDVQTEE